MPSFNAETPASGAGTNATSFQAAGVAAESTQNTVDNTVVLELGGRKFTKTDLIEKITHADTHIKALNTDLAEQRKLLGEVNDTLKKQVNAADILQKMKEQQAQAPGTPAVSTPAAEASKTLTLEEVLKSVREEQAQAASAGQAEANWKQVTATLTKQFGSATDTKVQAMLAEKGMSMAAAVALAKSAPLAFLALFPTATPKPNPLPSRNAVNTQSFNGGVERKTSGFAQAKNTKDSVAIYLQRLQELNA